MTKEQPITPTTDQPVAQSESGLAIVSMILGIISLTGPGLLLGIPAIVTASIALKKNSGGRSLSITGLVTGIISTVLSIIFLAFMAFVIIWSINHPEELDQQYFLPEQSEQPYGGSRT